MRQWTRYWAVQLALYGRDVVWGDRSAYDMVRYRKLRPGVSKGLTRRFLKLLWDGEIEI